MSLYRTERLWAELSWHWYLSLQLPGICLEFSSDKELTLSSLFFYCSQLVQVSLLTVRDVGSWWLSIPNTGIFMKSYIRGRKSLLTMIKKCKYREILKTVSAPFSFINLREKGDLERTGKKGKMNKCINEWKRKTKLEVGLTWHDTCIRKDVKPVTTIRIIDTLFLFLKFYA